MTAGPVPHGREHLAALGPPLQALAADVERLDAWGRHLATVLGGGGRLLAAGNGGSAAQAQHLTSELVGRYRDDRPPYSAIALHGETSSLTAIANDYGYGDALARQVRAHGRPGDVLVALSTSGRSANILAAVDAARDCGLVVWALTGPAPNPLQQSADDAVCVEAATATTQEVHQVAVHLLCAAFEHAITAATAPASAPPSEVRTAAPRRGTRRGTERGRVTVVGDALLDCDLEGTVERLCPDAPVPVVDAPRRHLRPGGAALAAALAARTGSVTLVTAVADDDAGRELAGLLDAAGVELVGLPLGGPTPEKVRVTTGGRPLLRLDHGGPPARPGPLSDAARAALETASAVLVSDYGRHITADADLRRVLTGLAGRRIPIVWDPHPRGGEPVPGVRLATPNRAEARHFAAGVEGDGFPALAVRAATLGRRWQAAGIAVTLGAAGALLWEGDGAPLVVPAPAVHHGDPCGAGDCFAATVVAHLAAGALPSEAVAEAVAAASAFVAGDRTLGRAGTAVDLRDGNAATAPPHDFTRHADEVVRAVRARGGTVVATGGCFDLLHAGHVRMLEAARALGDCLVVCLNSDASVRRIKGPDRPLVDETDRAGVLLALGAVDAVAIFDEDTPAAVLDRLRPDVFAKGGDYSVESLPEAALVAGWGGQTVILPYVEGRSTTRILEEAVRRGR